jgi:hypothetical protein
MRTNTSIAVAAVFLGLLGLYAFTAQQGVGWQDAGEFQRRAWIGDYAGVEGIARAHPLYVACLHLLARAFPPAAALRAMHAFSGLGLAMAAALCAWLVLRLTRSTAAAIGAGLLLGLSHMAWWMATVAEVYAWSLALLLLETALLYALMVRPRLRTLCWLALTSGLGLSVHNFALLSLPVWLAAAAWLIRRRALPGWSPVPAFAAWLIGAAPFLALVAGGLCGPQSFGGVLNDALFGGIYRGQVLGVTPALPRLLLAANLALFALSLLSPLWLAAVQGWRSRRRMQPRPFVVCLAALSGIHALFFLRYFVPDQATFSLPTLGLASLWAGMGLAALFERGGWSVRRQVLVLCAGLALPVLILGSGARVAQACAWEPPRARMLPFRDEARYWLLPWKQTERSAGDFAQAVFAQCGSNDVIYADSTAAGPLTVTLLAGPARPDRPLVVTYYDTWTGNPAAWQAFLARVAGRPLYVVSPVPGYVPASLLAGGYTFAKTGVLYRATF